MIKTDRAMLKFQENQDRSNFNIYKPVAPSFDAMPADANIRGPLIPTSEVNRQSTAGGQMGAGHMKLDRRSPGIGGLSGVKPAILTRTVMHRPMDDYHVFTPPVRKMVGGSDHYLPYSQNPAINNVRPTLIKEPNRIFQFREIPQVRPPLHQPPADLGEIMRPRLSADDMKSMQMSSKYIGHFTHVPRNPLYTGHNNIQKN
jgi:hypothetical protein